MKSFFLALCLLTLPQLLCRADLAYRYANSPTPADWKKWATKGHISIEAEALLWRLANPGLGYALLNEGQLSTLILNQPSYNWGVRVSAGYRFPSCWEVRGSYLHFNSRFSDTRCDTAESPSTLTPTFLATLDPPNQAFASAKMRDEFRVADASLLLPLVQGSYSQLNAFGGARYAYKRQKECYKYIDFMDMETSASQQAQFYGVGPLVGMMATLCPLPSGYLRGFSLDGTLATGFIIARRTSFFVNTADFFSTTQNQIKYPKATLGVPVFDAGVSASYSLDQKGWGFSGYVAYEMQWYQNASCRLVSANAGMGFPQMQVSGIGYFGWSFGVELTF